MPERIQVGEDAVAWLESGHLRPDPVDDAGNINTDGPNARRPQAGRDPGEAGYAVEEVEIGAVDGRYHHADDDHVAGWIGAFDLAHLDYVGRAVAIPRCCPHRSYAAARVPIVTMTLPLAWPSSTQRSASTTWDSA
jgi:hypothetical protein